MRESIHTYFQVGIVHWMSFPRMEALESLRTICRDDYFDAIEINDSKVNYRIEEAHALLEQSHLKVCYAAQPTLLGGGLNPNALDEAERKAAEEALIKSVDTTAYFGSKGMAFLSGKWKPETREEAYQQLLKTTTAVCKYAETKGILIELAVFDYDVDKAALIGPAELAARFAADVRKTCPNFGLMVDLSHIPLCRESIAHVVKTCKPYITHLHIGNAVADPTAEGYGDKHQRFGYPGSANDVAELVEYLNVLKEEGFYRAEDPLVLSMEVQPTPEEDELIVLANAKRCLNRAWAMVKEA